MSRLRMVAADGGSVGGSSGRVTVTTGRLDVGVLLMSGTVNA